MTSQHSKAPKHSRTSASKQAPLRIAIVGAGPAGCVLALLLSKFHCKIDLFDYRSDPRHHSTTRPRSINLALSTRGLTALREAGVLEQVLKIAVPMHGRCIHPILSDLQFHPYGQSDQHLLSVSRVSLSCILLDACEATDAVTLNFQQKCVDVDLEQPLITIQPVKGDGSKDGEPSQISPHLVVGADGAYSRVRAAMTRKDRFDFSQSYIPVAYKELSMTPVDLPREWLHIWPRDRFMLIALPNSDGSFTCTLFMDKAQFDSLQSRQSVISFFRTQFPDTVSTMPSLADDFFRNPTPSLVTIRCSPYNYKGNAVVIGDAAHAIVPFYGQGCNAAFEDCRLLTQELADHDWDFANALSSYSQTRKVHLEALADLALDHYEDMSSRSAKRLSVLYRRLEILANRFFPGSFLPLYSMVSFSNIPYADAVERAKRQEESIHRFVRFVSYASVATIAMLTIRRLCR